MTTAAPEAVDDLDRITAIYQAHDGSTFGTVCQRIARAAITAGEFHADQAADWRMSTRNMIGIAVRHLCTNGVLESTGEHRPAAAPQAHHRRSYVYRLTPLGERAAAAWRERSSSRIDEWPLEEPDQAQLF